MKLLLLFTYMYYRYYNILNVLQYKLYMYFIVSVGYFTALHDLLCKAVLCNAKTSFFSKMSMTTGPGAIKLS